MRHRMRHVEKERALAMLANKLSSTFGIATGQGRLIHWCFDDPIAIDQRQRLQSHDLRKSLTDRPLRRVIAIRQTKVFIEALSQRTRLSRPSQMPFSDTGGGIAALA